MRDGVTRAQWSSCPLCDRLREAGRHCLASGFDRPDRMTASCEAIVDSFGFCAQHGKLLARQGDASLAVRRIVSRAAAQIVELLADLTRNADRVQALFFAAEDECPGCRLHKHHVTHEIRALAARSNWRAPSQRLCFPHYRDVVHALQSADLPELARCQREVLRAASTVAEPFVGEEFPMITMSPAGAENVQATLRLVAGDPVGAFDIPDALDEAQTSGSSDDPASPAGDIGACSVCTGIARAQMHWRDDVATAARLGRDVWIVFPTCPVHVREGGEISPMAAAMTAHYAARVELNVLKRGVEWLERDHARRESAKQSVFYRHESPACILGQQRKMITRLPRCPACERLVVARDRSIAGLVQRLRHGPRQRGLRQVRHLCLKHFAAVFLLLPPDELRLIVAGEQAEALRAIASRWDETPPFRDAVAASVGDGGEHWRVAMRHFSTRINR